MLKSAFSARPSITRRSQKENAAFCNDILHILKLRFGRLVSLSVSKMSGAVRLLTALWILAVFYLALYLMLEIRRLNSLVFMKSDARGLQFVLCMAVVAFFMSIIFVAEYSSCAAACIEAFVVPSLVVCGWGCISYVVVNQPCVD